MQDKAIVGVGSEGDRGGSGLGAGDGEGDDEGVGVVVIEGLAYILIIRIVCESSMAMKCSPSVALGIVTAVVKEPVELAMVVPRITALRHWSPVTVPTIATPSHLM